MITRKLFFPSLLFIITASLSLAACSAAGKPPLAQNGYLDLSNWSFSANGTVNLDGQWEFYWRQLLSPEDLTGAQPVEPTGYFEIPGRWDGRVIDGAKQSGDGYATFRLKVRAPPGIPLLAVRITEESSAYRLWVNGEEVARNGIVGISRETMEPQYLLQVKPFEVSDETLEFVLQVSNFHHRKGGVWYPVEIGDVTDIAYRQDMKWALDLFIFGGLLIMGLYYLLIYLLRRTELSAIYFAVFCLLIAVRTVFIDTRFFVYLFPSFPWELIYKVELLTVTVTMPVMLMFIRSLFPAESSRIVVRIIQVICGVASLIAIAFNARISSHIVVPYQFVLLFLYFYITYVLVMASAHKKRGARTILFGMSVFYMTVLNDVLAANDIIYTLSMAPLGMLVLVMSQSFGLSQRFAQAFSSVERLSTELEQRIVVEQYLQQTQNRLSEMLDTVDDSIIAVDEAGEISFCNSGISRLIGVAQDSLPGSPLKVIFPAGRIPDPIADGVALALQEEGTAQSFNDVKVLSAVDEVLLVDLELATLSLEDENLAVLLIKPSSTLAQDGKAAVHAPAKEVIEGLNLNRQRLQALEDSLGDVLPERESESSLLRDSIHAIDMAIEQVGSFLSDDSTAASKRKVAADLMNASLEYWTDDCGQGKLDFARESRLWKVYLDQDGGKRTQTLDRYLSPSTIPKQPRWSKVSGSARFVLASCDADSPARSKVNTLLAKLQSL